MKPYGLLANSTTDEELLEYVKTYLVTINHPVSTCRMTAKGSSEGVVDPDLLVKKTLGLRIVDASVFVSIVLGLDDSNDLTGHFLAHRSRVSRTGCCVHSC